MDDALKLSLKALKKVSNEKLASDMVDIAVLYYSDRKVKVLSHDEVAKYLEAK